MEFKVYQKEIELQSRGWRPTFHDVSKEIIEIVQASGIKNGFANGLAALAPALIGLFITLTGQFSGGLLCLVFTGAAATLAAAILVIQKY